MPVPCIINEGVMTAPPPVIVSLTRNNSTGIGVGGAGLDPRQVFQFFSTVAACVIRFNSRCTQGKHGDDRCPRIGTVIRKSVHHRYGEE